MMKSCRLKIFCDFDGTITKNDVWINSLGKFINDKVKFENICEDFNSQKISTRECNLSQLELIENFSFDKFDSYLDEEQIDDHFPDFVDFCRQNNHELKIVSSGMDYYLNYILKRKQIVADFFSTKIIFDETNNKISCNFEYGDEYCKECETCKRNILINNTNDLDNEVSVFIGDGVSDFCVSRYADIVFAKGRLASYCWKNNITYFEYKNFLDVKNKIIKLKENNKIKQRQEAGVRRRDVVMGG